MNKKQKSPGWYCILSNNKARWISPKKIIINRNTPVGDPVDYYEIKPYGGRKYIKQSDILGIVNNNGEFEIHNCIMTKDRLSIIKGIKFTISKDLFYNGWCYTTIKNPFRKPRYE